MAETVSHYTPPPPSKDRDRYRRVVYRTSADNRDRLEDIADVLLKCRLVLKAELNTHNRSHSPSERDMIEQALSLPAFLRELDQ